MPEEKRKYLVEYTLSYDHVVRVGIEAIDADEAKQKAADAFEDGTIWDSTPMMPLLYDDFEEKEDNVLTFKATEVREWPDTDISVVSQQDLMKAKQERDNLKMALSATQEAQSQAMQYADKLENVLRRLAEKVECLNAVQDIAAPVSPADWSDLGRLSTEARSILTS